MLDSDLLYSAARHVHTALADPSAPTEVDLAVVDALLTGGPFDAVNRDQVLALLVVSGALDQPERGRFVVTRPPSTDLMPTDSGDLFMLIAGLAQQAARANLTLRPHTWRYNPVSDPQPLSGRDAAVRWFDIHRSALLAALEVTIEHLDELDLVVALADALDGLLDWTGHHHDRARVADQAIAALHAAPWREGVLDDSSERTRLHLVRVTFAHVRLAQVRTDLDEHGDAVREAETALEFARKSGDSAAVAAAFGARGRALHGQNYPAAALLDLRRALAVDQERGDDHGAARHHHLLGEALAALGRHEQALVELRLASVALAGIGDRLTGARVLTTMGSVHRRANSPSEAFTVLREAAEVLADIGSPAHLGDVHAEVARTYRTVHAIANAERHFRIAAEHYRAGRLDDRAARIDTEFDTAT